MTDLVNPCSPNSSNPPQMALQVISYFSQPTPALQFLPPTPTWAKWWLSAQAQVKLKCSNATTSCSKTLPEGWFSIVASPSCWPSASCSTSSSDSWYLKPSIHQQKRPLVWPSNYLCPACSLSGDLVPWSGRLSPHEVDGCTPTAYTPLVSLM